MDAIVGLLLTALFICSYLYFTRYRNYSVRSLINEFPGPKVYPVIGTTLPVWWMTREELFCYFRTLARKYGPIYRTWLGHLPAVHITDPKYVGLVLNNSVHISKGYGYKFIVPWLGDGLLTSTGERWHRHRKLLTPTFHFKILESFMDVFVDKSTVLVELLSKEANGKAFNVFPYITHYALDVICETTMGIQINAMSRDGNKYVDAVYNVCADVIYRVARIWLSVDFIYYRTARGKKFLNSLSVLHDTTDKVIDERRQLLRQNDDHVIENDLGAKKRKTFLDLLLELSINNTALTRQQIREEVDTFMFAGHDTTTASICWTIFLLGLHPEIQEKTYEEVSHVLSDNKPLQFNDLNDLKYLERVIKESLRLYPSVGIISRFAAEDIKFEKYTIPAGTSVTLHIYDIQRNENYFPEPNKFDPDRFLPENSKDRHPFAYIPFSAGPRNCIGQKFALMEEKTALSYIIKNFKIKSMQNTENVRPVNDVIIRPSEGLLITLEKRKVD